MLDLFNTKNHKDNLRFNLIEDKYSESFDKKYSNNKVLIDFFTDYGGASFDKGLFKIHNKSSSFYWTNLVCRFFPKYKDKICCFAYDWMGRQFAVDLDNPSNNYLFDPATGEDFELPQTLTGFFNEELVEYREETLVTEDFNYVLDRLNIHILPIDKCIGYKKLLFLGGDDDLDNTEVVDMDVYWDMNYKIYCKVKNLKEGTIINKIDFE
jgi:hypothetical protein